MSPLKHLYVVKIDEDDFEYDAFVSAVVWAETAAEAKDHVRKHAGKHLLQTQKRRLRARRAKLYGTVHTHWHAG